MFVAGVECVKPHCSKSHLESLIVKSNTLISSKHVKHPSLGVVVMSYANYNAVSDVLVCWACVSCILVGLARLEVGLHKALVPT